MRTATCHPTRKHVAHGLCRNCYQAKYAKEHPEYNSNDRKQNATCHPDKKMVGKGQCQACYMRDWWLKKNYGLTWDQVAEMMAEQDNQCPICLQTIEFYGQGPIAQRGFAVDHCHRTGAVRGLLCDRCNNGIGCMGDDVSNLRRAITYLEERS